MKDVSEKLQIIRNYDPVMTQQQHCREEELQSSTGCSDARLAPPLPNAIGKLPDELLAEIFTLHLHGGTPANTFHVRIQSVCHRWHNIAISTPRLWVKIRVLLSYYCCTKLAIVKRHLELSRNAPLDIEVRFLDALNLKPTFPQTTVLDMIVSALPRCQILHVFRHPTFPYILPLSSELPLLEELYVTPRWGEKSDTLRSGSFMPRLHSFVIEDYRAGAACLRISPVYLFGSSLTTLHFTQAVHPYDALSLIMASPQLRTLSWKYRRNAPWPTHPLGPNPLILDFLEDFRLHGDPYKVFTHLHAPNVVTFNHGDPQLGDIRDEGIFGPEPRFPLLQHLKLVGSHRHTSAEHLRRLFQNHPLLEQVTLTMSLSSPELWLGLLVLVENDEQPGSQGHPIQDCIAPRLRHLVIHSDDFGIHAQPSVKQTLTQTQMLQSLLRNSEARADGGFSIRLSASTISPSVLELEAEFPTRFFVE